MNVPHGLDTNALADNDAMMEFLHDAYKQRKVIDADGEPASLLNLVPFASKLTENDAGIVLSSDVASENFAKNFIAAVGMHRFWDREPNLYN
jgi:catalase